MSIASSRLIKDKEANVNNRNSLANTSTKYQLNFSLHGTTDVSRATSESTSKITSNTRYKNLEDLVRQNNGEKLQSYLVPEMSEISENLKNKKMKVSKKTDLKDEFDQMVNWKRVFE